MRKILLIFLILISLLSACKRSTGSVKSDETSIFSSDETQEASKIILEANEDLKKVKAIYKANKDRAEELKLAIGAKDVEKVKASLNDIVLQINDGLVSGEAAYTKIEKAESMDINSTYKEYLGLKKQALRKHLDAFELRRQGAQRFRDRFGVSDPKMLDQAQAELTDKEEDFRKLIGEGKDLSKEANDLYEESMKNIQ